MQTSLRRALLQRSILNNQVRTFAAKTAAPEPEGKRKNANPGYYNIRFSPSTGVDNNYVDYGANVRGAHGFEPH